MPSVPIAMPSLIVGVPKICALPPAASIACDGGVGELLQARVARRDRRVAVGDADHRLVEVAFLVAEGVVHRPVRRARDAFGDVPGAAVDRPWRSRSWRAKVDRSAAIIALAPDRARSASISSCACSCTRSSTRSRSTSRSSACRSPSTGTASPTWSASACSSASPRARARLPQFAARGWTRRDVEDLLFYGVLGVVIGGRLGYVLFYKPGYYAAHPLEIFAVWKGGMSFHGGLLGVIVAMALVRATAPAAASSR